MVHAFVSICHNEEEYEEYICASKSHHGESINVHRNTA